MEAADQEFAGGAIDFMERSNKTGKSFFVWFKSTRMHVWTRLAKKQGSKQQR